SMGRGVQAAGGTIRRNGEERRSSAGPGDQDGLTSVLEHTPSAHSGGWEAPRDFVPMDERRGAGDLLLVERVVGRVDDELTRCAEGLLGDLPQPCIDGETEREPVIHRRRVRKHVPVTYAAVARDRGTRTREVQRAATSDLGKAARGDQVIRRFGK